MVDYRAGRPASADLALSLALDLPADAGGALRMRFLAGGWKSVLTLAAQLRLLPALAMAADVKGLTAGIPHQRSAAGEASAPVILADALDTHHRRSDLLRDRLGELLDLFAERGIHPVLLKGARALWTGTPPWRSLRDFDLLCGPAAAPAAVDAALAAGFHPNDAFSAPATWHHNAELYRDDLPGWLEIHKRAGVQRMEVILPTARLMQSAIRIGTTSRGHAVMALPISLHILHCLMHHHVGHRGDYYGLIDFKGLYEFAADVAALDLAARTDLLNAAQRHPRLFAMLELWLAAAADIFRLAVLLPLRVAPDADDRWRLIKARAAQTTPPLRFAGLPGEVSMALRSDRLAHLPGGATPFGRLKLRIDALRAIVTRAVPWTD